MIYPSISMDCLPRPASLSIGGFLWPTGGEERKKVVLAKSSISWHLAAGLIPADAIDRQDVATTFFFFSFLFGLCGISRNPPLKPMGGRGGL